MKMKWKSHAGIHRECLCTAPGGKQHWRHSYHTVIRQIYQPPYKKMTANMSSSAEQPALYPLVHQDLGKAGPAWLYPSLGKKWMNFCWSGWIQARKSKSNTQGSVPNPDLPFQQVRPVFSPLWGFLQDNKQKTKGFKLWSRAVSVKWAHKTGPKSLFSIGSRIFTVSKVWKPSQAQITERKLQEKRHILSAVTLLWYQRVLSSWRGNHQLCHRHHRRNWERGFLLPLAWTILLLLWDQRDPPRWARCLWSHSDRKDSLGLLIPAGDRRDLSPKAAQIITCFRNNRLLTCFLAGSFQLRGRQRQTGLEMWDVFSLK